MSNEEDSNVMENDESDQSDGKQNDDDEDIPDGEGDE
jgi:hypothetical protein